MMIRFLIEVGAVFLALAGFGVMLTPGSEWGFGLIAVLLALIILIASMRKDYG